MSRKKNRTRRQQAHALRILVSDLPDGEWTAERREAVLAERPDWLIEARKRRLQRLQELAEERTRPQETTLEDVLLDVAHSLGGDPGRHAPTKVLASRTTTEALELPFTRDGRGGRMDSLLDWTAVVLLSPGTYSESGETDYVLEEPVLALLRYDARLADSSYPNGDRVGPEVLRVYSTYDEETAIADLVEQSRS